MYLCLIIIITTKGKDMGNLRKIFLFYYEGFRGMTVGRTLWAIILIKLFIIFAVLRVFFFQPALSGTGGEKADKVRENLITTKP